MRSMKEELEIVERRIMEMVTSAREAHGQMVEARRTENMEEFYSAQSRWECACGMAEGMRDVYACLVKRSKRKGSSGINKSLIGDNAQRKALTKILKNLAWAQRGLAVASTSAVTTDNGALDPATAVRIRGVINELEELLESQA